MGRISAEQKRRVDTWLERVCYDMDTADAMYKTGRYLYVVFMAQQAVEKAIKALIEANGSVAPFEHNLRKLLIVAESEKEVPAEWWERIDFLSQYYLSARYKEDIAKLQRKISSEVAEEFLDFGKEMVKWCTVRINSIA